MVPVVVVGAHLPLSVVPGQHGVVQRDAVLGRVALPFVLVVINAVNVDDPFVVVTRASINLDQARVSPCLNFLLAVATAQKHLLFVARVLIGVLRSLILALDRVGGRRMVQTAHREDRRGRHALQRTLTDTLATGPLGDILNVC